MFIRVVKVTDVLKKGFVIYRWLFGFFFWGRRELIRLVGREGWIGFKEGECLFVELKKGRVKDGKRVNGGYFLELGGKKNFVGDFMFERSSFFKGEL